MTIEQELKDEIERKITQREMNLNSETGAFTSSFVEIKMLQGELKGISEEKARWEKKIVDIFKNICKLKYPCLIKESDFIKLKDELLGDAE